VRYRTLDFRFLHGLQALDTHLRLEDRVSGTESKSGGDSPRSSFGRIGRTMIIQVGGVMMYHSQTCGLHKVNKARRKGPSLSL